MTNLRKYSQLFPTRSSKIHNNKYDYSNINYINSDTPVEIVCPKHGKFLQIPHNHLMGKGCPRCNQSHGERKIEIYLIGNNIKYETQKKFNDCINKDRLPFDFWVEDRNLLIEFDGAQHFIPVYFMGGLDKLEYVQKCDKIKDEYCLSKGIRLLRINYKDLKANRIDQILSNYLS